MGAAGICENEVVLFQLDRDVVFITETLSPRRIAEDKCTYSASLRVLFGSAVVTNNKEHKSTF